MSTTQLTASYAGVTMYSAASASTTAQVARLVPKRRTDVTVQRLAGGRHKVVTRVVIAKTMGLSATGTVKVKGGGHTCKATVTGKTATWARSPLPVGSS